jgi:serine/threonine-protein kinase RsbW
MAIHRLRRRLGALLPGTFLVCRKTGKLPQIRQCRTGSVIPRPLVRLDISQQINKFRNPGNASRFGPRAAFLLCEAFAMTGMRILSRASGSQPRFSEKRSRSSVLEIDSWMPSAIQAISPLVDRLMRLIEGSQCVPGEEFGVELALREALGNAVVHGNRENPETKVHVRCRCGPGNEILIVVTDQGKGFDFGKVMDNGSDPTSVHGHGVPLMKAYMDDVHFARGGSEVHMRKRSRTAPHS